MKIITLYLTDPDYDSETDGLSELLNGISDKFEPCFMVGRVGRWNGTFNGYKYLETMEDLRNIISGYDEIKIAQAGTRLRFRLSHHDGTHYMELRKLTDYGYNNRHKYCLVDYSTAVFKFIERYTKNFGKVGYKF